RPRAADPHHHRPSGARRAGLARRRDRPADVGRGGHGRRGLAGLAASPVPGSTLPERRIAMRSGTMPGTIPDTPDTPDTPARDDTPDSPDETTLTRRGMLMKVGILVNGVVAAAIGVPIVAYLLSSLSRGRGGKSLSWVPLGPVGQFPEGETRLATFRNPLVVPTGAKRVDRPSWAGRRG